MNQQREFISDTFHALAQPITALRASVELGLLKSADAQASRQSFEGCLRLVDQLMQDLAVFREIAGLDEAPALQLSAGHTLLKNCAEEMAPVAQDSGVALHLTVEPVAIQCNEPMFQRAVFVLLDEVIASTPRGGEISISLRRGEAGVVLEVRPGTLRSQRQKLCRKLIEFAGASSLDSFSDCFSVTFREACCLVTQIPSAGEQVLISQEGPLDNEAAKEKS